MRIFTYWSCRSEMAKALCPGKRCAEIGVFRGGFSSSMLGERPAVLVLVDPWKSQPKNVYPNDNANVDDVTFEKYYQEVCSTFGKNPRVSIIRGFSVEASRSFHDEEFDMVYLDAIHTTEAVFKDACTWWPKVKPGGWLCGHDFTGKHGDNVKAGVIRFMEEQGICFLDAVSNEEYASWGIRKRGRLLIPKIIHQVWIGKTIPESLIRSMETWTSTHQEWKRWLWAESEINVPGWTTRPISSVNMINRTTYDRLSIAARKSNILRLEVVYQYGGVYCDCDYDAQKNIEYPIDGLTAFGTKYTTLYDPSTKPQPWEDKLCNAMFGSVSNHPFLMDAISASVSVARDDVPFGSSVLSKAAKLHPDVACFEPWVFSPYRWNEPEKSLISHPEAWAIHRWAKNW